MQEDRGWDARFELLADAGRVIAGALAKPAGVQRGRFGFHDHVAELERGLRVGQIDIDVAAKPVPLTAVTFSVTDASGKVVVHRSTSNTGDVMQLGWNTTRVANGTYTIRVEGAAGTKAVTPTTLTVKVRN